MEAVVILNTNKRNPIKGLHSVGIEINYCTIIQNNRIDFHFQTVNGRNIVFKFEFNLNFKSPHKIIVILLLTKIMSSDKYITVLSNVCNILYQHLGNQVKK